MPNCPLCGKRVLTAAYREHLQGHEAASRTSPLRSSALRPGVCWEPTALPPTARREQREQGGSTTREVLEASAPSRPPVISFLEHLGPKTVEFPTTLDVDSVFSWLPSGKLQFDYPRSHDDWSKFSTNLRPLCTPLSEETCGARAIDHLHEILFRSLDLSSPPQSRVLHQKSHKQLSKIKGELQSLRKDLKSAKGPVRVEAKRRIYSALMIQKELKKENAKEILAQEVRSNLKLLRRNPKKLSQKIWGGSLSSTPPAVDADAASAFFTRLFATSTPDLSAPDWLSSPFHSDLSPAPTFSVADIRHALRRTRNSSAPGLDGVTYALIKALPWLHHLLAHLFSLVAAQSQVPIVWRNSVTVLLHKKGPLEDLSNFRPISLTPTISKLFHSLIAQRIESQLLESHVLDTTVQKGFLTGISGCVEHDLVLDQLLHDTKSARGSIAISLLDLKNAFGSVPFSRIIFAAKHYGLPIWIQRYLSELYTRLYSTFTCSLWTTCRVCVEVGVAQRYTLTHPFSDGDAACA